MAPIMIRIICWIDRSCLRVVLAPSQRMSASLSHTSLSEVTDAAAHCARCGPVDKAGPHRTGCRASGLDSFNEPSVLSGVKHPRSPNDCGHTAGLMCIILAIQPPQAGCGNACQISPVVAEYWFNKACGKTDRVTCPLQHLGAV